MQFSVCRSLHCHLSCIVCRYLQLSWARFTAVREVVVVVEEEAAAAP